jgi:integrase
MRLEFRFHDLRRLSATLLFANGGHPKIVPERPGPTSISELLDRYSHFSTDMQLRIAART